MADIVLGKNAVEALIQSGKLVRQVMCSNHQRKDPKIRAIMEAAQARGIPYQYITPKRMDELAREDIHQGVIAYIPSREYVSIDDLLDIAEEADEAPFLLIVDSVQDPHNLGAIVRTAVAAGVHGIVIPQRRAAQVNQTVAKVAAGAVEFCNFSRVANLATEIKTLKSKGVWIVGLDHQATQNYDSDKIDYNGPIAVVVGNEGEGLTRIVAQQCDYLVKIPMKGPVDSLNASVSAALILYKVMEKRGL